MNTFNNYMSRIPQSFIADLGDFAIALLIIIIGWFAAKLLASIVRKGIIKIDFFENFFNSMGVKTNIHKIADIAGIITFVIVFAYVLVAFFQYINLPAISEPINNFANSIPQYVGVLALVIFTWLASSLTRMFILKLGQENNVDSKVGNGTTKSLANAGYGFVILFFLPAILAGLGLSDIVGPVNNIIGQITSYIPNVIAAVIIIVIGLFVAKLVKQIVTSILQATKIDTFTARLGLKDVSLSQVAGILAYIVIIIPVAISAINRLGIESISSPSQRMLEESILLIPNIVGALMLLTLAFVAGKFISSMLEDILKNMGFDTFLQKAGIPLKSNVSLSKIISTGAFVLLMLFAISEAGNLLGLEVISQLVQDFIEFATLVLGGIATIIIGLIISSVAYDAVMSTSHSNKTVASLVKYAIILLSVAIGLQQMGIADTVITNVFTLVFGAAAVAAALAFGIGGREVAGKQLEKWVSNNKDL
ncbi:mechanosensitive ion channel [Candidatus Gracilibacteria bacterium]|nr:mechanosensitive ion channel [Candidatus Gracilibacteria bacterium]